MDFPSWLISYVCTSPQGAVWLAHNQGIGFGMGVRPRDRVRCGGTAWVGDLTEQMDAVPGSHTDLQLAPWSILVILVRPPPRGVVLVVFEGWGALAARFRCGSRWPSLVHLRLLAIDEAFLQIVSFIVVDIYPFCSLSHISEHKGWCHKRGTTHANADSGKVARSLLRESFSSTSYSQRWSTRTRMARHQLHTNRQHQEHLPTRMPFPNRQSSRPASRCSSFRWS
ncbi:hypothetical protein IQ07DRAFT_105767 [Pyrenochaeta sp. DS3sAY3a]|nr:hypothetical protein IQ07DRAFT_105767 [Pyrenochaeta sp. DS3sAY3a]